jgi:hypothetical protein
VADAAESVAEDAAGTPALPLRSIVVQDPDIEIGAD